MQQVLILARGFEIPQATRMQVSTMRTCVEQLERDPRVKAIYGISGHSIGCAVLCEVSTWQDADRVAAILQVSGLPNVEFVNLLPGEQLKVGLEEAERFATISPYRQTSAPAAFAG